MPAIQARQITPKSCIVIHVTHFKILGPVVFGMGKAKHFKFGGQIDRSEY